MFQCFGLKSSKSDFRPMEKNLSLQNVINAVREFHDSFKIPNSDKPNSNLTEDDVMLRYRLMAEENDEYLEAAKAGDIVVLVGIENVELGSTITNDPDFDTFELIHNPEPVLSVSFKPKNQQDLTKLKEF